MRARPNPRSLAPTARRPPKQATGKTTGRLALILRSVNREGPVGPILQYAQVVHKMRCDGLRVGSEKGRIQLPQARRAVCGSRLVFEDDLALTIKDEESDPEETRFASIGMGALARVLVVVYTHRGENIRVISARLADPHERSVYEEAR